METCGSTMCRTWSRGPVMSWPNRCAFNRASPRLSSLLVYNIGRIAAAVGTVVFGLFTKVGDHRVAMICAGSLFLPAAIIAWWLPELSDRQEETPIKAAAVGALD